MSRRADYRIDATADRQSSSSSRGHIYPVRAQRAGNRFRIIALANCYVQQQQQHHNGLADTTTAANTVEDDNDLVDSNSDSSVGASTRPTSSSVLIMSAAQLTSKRDISSYSDARGRHPVDDERVDGRPSAGLEQLLDNQSQPALSDSSGERPVSHLPRRSRLPYGIPRPVQKNYIVGVGD